MILNKANSIESKIIHTIEGEIRTPKDSERYFALVKVDKVNNDAPDNTKNKIL